MAHRDPCERLPRTLTRGAALERRLRVRRAVALDYIELPVRHASIEGMRVLLQPPDRAERRALVGCEHEIQKCGSGAPCETHRIRPLEPRRAGPVRGEHDAQAIR